jgi:hypothetical protein
MVHDRAGQPQIRSAKGVALFQGHRIVPDVREILVDIEHAGDRYYTVSAQLPGLLLSDDDHDTLVGIVPDAIKVLIENDGRRVIHIALDQCAPPPNSHSQYLERRTYLVEVAEQ